MVWLLVYIFFLQFIVNLSVVEQILVKVIPPTVSIIIFFKPPRFSYYDGRLDSVPFSTFQCRVMALCQYSSGHLSLYPHCTALFDLIEINFLTSLDGK